MIQHKCYESTYMGNISTKKNKRLILTDTISQKKQMTKTTEHWRCTRYNSLKCRSGSNRWEQNLIPSLPNIKDRHFIIPIYSDFCLFDSGVMDWILIFGDRDNVQAHRVHNSLWLCDGIFKICQMQLYQLYTIHIQIDGFYPPCLYALLPNKTEQTYSKFLKAIASVSDNAQPSRTLLDFERAAVNAFTSAFPESSINGCYFHLCQAFLRKVNELGLKKAYENNCKLSLTAFNTRSQFCSNWFSGTIVRERHWDWACGGPIRSWAKPVR